MRPYFSFGLILWDIPNSITPQTPSACCRFRSDCSYSLVPPVQAVPPPLTPSPNFFLSLTEEPAKACICICTRDMRALQQLALNVHVKRSYLTCERPRRIKKNKDEKNKWNEYIYIYIYILCFVFIFLKQHNITHEGK